MPFKPALQHDAGAAAPQIEPDLDVDHNFGCVSQPLVHELNFQVRAVPFHAAKTAVCYLQLTLSCNFESNEADDKLATESQLVAYMKSSALERRSLLQELTLRGVRITGQRKILIKTIQDAARHLDAASILALGCPGAFLWHGFNFRPRPASQVQSGVESTRNQGGAVRRYIQPPTAVRAGSIREILNCEILKS